MMNIQYNKVTVTGFLNYEQIQFEQFYQGKSYQASTMPIATQPQREVLLTFVRHFFKLLIINKIKKEPIIRRFVALVHSF